MADKCVFPSGRWERGFHKWRRDVPHPGDMDPQRHSTSLYLSVISTLGNVNNTVGYSFPLLPLALHGGLQCGWGADLKIPSTFAVVKFIHGRAPYFSLKCREPMSCLVFWGWFWVAKNIKKARAAMPFFLLKRGRDTHKGRERLTHTHAHTQKKKQASTS